MAALVNSAVYRTDSWHHIERLSGGTFGDDQITPIEAYTRGGLNFEWQMVPSQIPWEGRILNTGKFKLVRGPLPLDPEENGVHIVSREVSEGFGLVQNSDLVELAQTLHDTNSWAFEGAGVLRKGETVFLELRLERDMVIGGKEHERHTVYFMLAEEKGVGAGWGGLTSTRVVCANTFDFAIAGGTLFKIRHMGDALRDFQVVTAMAEYAAKEADAQEARLNRFFTNRIGQEQFEKFLEVSFPHPTMPARAILGEQARALNVTHDDLIKEAIVNGDDALLRYERERTRAEDLRQETVEAFIEHNDTFEDSALTQYAAWQAVTAVTNHSDRFAGSGTADGVAATLFGNIRRKHQRKAYAYLNGLT